jgi:hypothetical protein
MGRFEAPTWKNNYMWYTYLLKYCLIFVAHTHTHTHTHKHTHIHFTTVAEGRIIQRGGPQ